MFPPLLTLSMFTDLVIPIIGKLIVVVTDAVSPVITIVKSLPTADALFRNVPSLELAVAVNVSVDDPDALTVEDTVQVSICPEMDGSLVVSPVVELPT